ncbi:hypothetical protein [Rufibacter hautae]|uniref:hypothetical protein n=1 Tax=Rufibacter hautae TaxID=2595005 RepID=UPI001680739C|nr:hypothetical protein [Rufibacter hautae]
MEPTLQATSVSEVRTAGCINFSYFNKISGTVNFGAANGDRILVRFLDGMSLEARQQVLSRYPQFHSIEGEVALDSGTLTIVRLLANSGCGDAEKLGLKLLRESAVTYVTPFFNRTSSDPEEPLTGLSNEFMVAIEPGKLAQLEQLIAQTRTSIVMSFSEEVHVLSADKNSSCGILDILTKFNQQNFVTVAEPNLVYSFPTASGEMMNAQTAKKLKKGSWKAAKAEKKNK